MKQILPEQYFQFSRTGGRELEKTLFVFFSPWCISFTIYRIETSPRATSTRTMFSIFLHEWESSEKTNSFFSLSILQNSPYYLENSGFMQLTFSIFLYS